MMGFEPENYNAIAIAREIMQMYDLGKISAESVEDTLRHKVESICRKLTVIVENQQIDLWTKSERMEGDRKRHYFSKEERNRIITSPELLEYLTKQLFDDATITAYNKAKEEAEKANEQYEEIMSELQYSASEYIEVDVTDEDVKKKKFEMMIEAIFLKFFTPIDEKKLKRDMQMSYVPSGADITTDMLMARDRLTNGLNYYQPKKENN